LKYGDLATVIKACPQTVTHCKNQPVVFLKATAFGHTTVYARGPAGLSIGPRVPVLPNIGVVSINPGLGLAVAFAATKPTQSQANLRMAAH
jgi:hypothetical protein